MAETPKLTARAPALAAGALATVSATIALSFVPHIGVATTYVTLALGSVATGGFSAMYEAWIRRGHAAARSAVSRRKPGESQHAFEKRLLHETSVFPAVRNDGTRDVPWRTIGLTSAGVLAACVLVIVAVVALAGRPVSAISNPGPALAHPAVPQPAQTVTVTPTPTPTVTTPSPSPTVTTATPTLTPTATPSPDTTPDVTGTPTPTPSPSESSTMVP